MEKQEVIKVKIPFKESTISLKLKPEMRNKKVRLRGALAKGAGNLFLRIYIVDERQMNYNSDFFDTNQNDRNLN